jgi:hypothetical protein
MVDLEPEAVGMLGPEGRIIGYKDVAPPQQEPPAPCKFLVNF